MLCWPRASEAQLRFHNSPWLRLHRPAPPRPARPPLLLKWQGTQRGASKAGCTGPELMPVRQNQMWSVIIQGRLGSSLGGRGGAGGAGRAGMSMQSGRAGRGRAVCRECACRPVLYAMDAGGRGCILRAQQARGMSIRMSPAGLKKLLSTQPSPPLEQPVCAPSASLLGQCSGSKQAPAALTVSLHVSQRSAWLTWTQCRSPSP